MTRVTSSPARALAVITASLTAAVFFAALVWIPATLLDAADELVRAADALDAALVSEARRSAVSIAEAHALDVLPVLERARREPLVERHGDALFVAGARVTPAPTLCADAAAAHAGPESLDAEHESVVREVELAAASADGARLERAVRAGLADEVNHRRLPQLAFAGRRRVVAALVRSGRADALLLRILVGGTASAPSASRPSAPSPATALAALEIEPLVELLLRARPRLCGEHRARARADVRALATAVGVELGAADERFDEDVRDELLPQQLPDAAGGDIPLAWAGHGVVVPVRRAGANDAHEVSAVLWRVTPAALAERIRTSMTAAHGEPLDVHVAWSGGATPLSAVDVRVMSPAAQRRTTAERVRSAARLGAGAVGVGGLACVGLLAGAMRAGRRRAALRRDLVTAVTHELRTPLASMRLQLDALERRGLDARTTETLARLGHDVSSLESMVENVLGYGRIARGGVVLRRAPFQLASLCSEVIDVQRDAQQTLPGDVTWTLEGEDVRVDGDAELIRMVLSNLLANAARHNPKAHRQVHVRVQTAPGVARVVVEDDGAGISAADHIRVFRPFERSLTLSRGAGLGLTLAREIARLHGGDVRLEATGPTGSAFVLELPTGITGGTA